MVRLFYDSPQCKVLSINLNRGILVDSNSSYSINSIGFSGSSSVEDGGELS